MIMYGHQYLHKATFTGRSPDETNPHQQSTQKTQNQKLKRSALGRGHVKTDTNNNLMN
jgi:hypothetical protein